MLRYFKVLKVSIFYYNLGILQGEYFVLMGGLFLFFCKVVTHSQMLSRQQQSKFFAAFPEGGEGEADLHLLNFGPSQY